MAEQQARKHWQKDVGLRAWTVCLAAFLTNGIIFGIINNFGVIMRHIIIEYNKHDEPRFRLSLAGSLCVGITFFGSPISSIIADRIGIRKTTFCGSVLATIAMLLSSSTATKGSISIAHLSVTYGVLLGVGFSLVYTPSLVILGHYFEKRLGVVNGIVTAGSSVFTVLLPIFLPQIFSAYGVRTTFQLLSLMVFVLILCSFTFAEKPKCGNEITDCDELEKICITKESVSAQRRGLLNEGIWHNKMYILWVVAIPIALFGYFVPYAYLPDHVKLILPGYNSDLLVTFIGAFSGIGRLLFGKISDCARVNSVILQQFAFIAIGTLTILLIFPKTYFMFIILCSGFGLFDGCFISLIGPIAHSIVGQKDASQAIGFLLGFCSIPLTIGPPLAGYLYDLNGSYILAFILAGVPPFLGALLMLPILRQQKREEALKKFASSKESTNTKTDDTNGFEESVRVMNSEEQKAVV